MSQVDSFAAAGGLSGLATRQAFNAILDALATCSSGATAPNNPFAGMIWRDTSTSPAQFKIRNDANTAWVSALQAFGAAAQGETFLAATTQAAQRSAIGLPLTDNDDLSIDPDSIGTRGNMAAAIAAQAFGVGRTMQDVSASRAINTLYTNNTGRTIWFSVMLGGNYGQSIEVDGEPVASIPSTTGVDAQMSSPVPDGSTYEVVGTTTGINVWVELR